MAEKPRYFFWFWLDEKLQGRFRANLNGREAVMQQLPDGYIVKTENPDDSFLYMANCPAEDSSAKDTGLRSPISEMQTTV